MRNTLNIDKLARLVRAKRGERVLRTVSQEILEGFGEVSPSTLSRVENGRAPDMETFLRLCDWLQVPAAQLIEVEGAQLSDKVTPEGTQLWGAVTTLESIALQIRADKSLDEKTALALVEVIRAVYRGSNR